MRLARVIEQVFDQPWAITPDAMGKVTAIVERHAANDHRMSEFDNPGREPSVGTVMVLPIEGTLIHRGSMAESSGLTSYRTIGGWLDQAAKAEVATVVLDVHSPGGDVSGLPEIADRIHALAQTKRVIGVANSMAASAGMWLLSQASEVVVSASSLVGSIGIVYVHRDQSKSDEQKGIVHTVVTSGGGKADESPYQPLSDVAKAKIQERVDHAYGLFVSAVARGRRISEDSIRGLGAKLMTAQEAINAGLADKMGTLESVIEGLLSASAQTPARSADSYRRRFSHLTNQNYGV